MFALCGIANHLYTKDQCMDRGIHQLLMKKAGALLARRTYSRLDLQNKLASFGDAAQIESVLNRLERLNLLNDVDYAYNFALRHVRHLGWSQARVKTALLGHRVEPAIIERVLDQVGDASGGEESVIWNYVTRRYGKTGLPTDSKGVRRLFMQLRQRGFEEEDIIGALKGKLPDAVLRRFQTGEYLD